MTAPRDGYERYFTEKLWEWIPEVYRHEDGVALHPDVLRSIIELLGPSAAAARRSIDRLWEDQFGEFADDWALPYIGELVGTRLVNALNRRGRRADVVHTIFYRRRKGTLAVLRMLVRDITGWDGVVVEAFRRLARTPHRLDAPLEGPGASVPGSVTRTPPGGFADLRRARGGDLVDGPFDEYSHTADLRQLRGHLGRVNIPNLNFHLFRQRAFEIRFATPVDLGARRFTFDPSGRDVQLFTAPSFDPDRTWPRGADECLHPTEWGIVAPLSCRLLGEARYRLERGDFPAGLEPQLAGVVGALFQSEAQLRRVLLTLLVPNPFTEAQFNIEIYPVLAASIVADSPKLHLLPDADADADAVAVSVGADAPTAPVLARERTTAANLETRPTNAETWGAALAPVPGRQITIDPRRGRFRLTAAPAGGARVFAPIHCVGLFGTLGASTYDRRATLATEGVAQLPNGGIAQPGPVTGFALPVTGKHEFVDSKTYEPTTPAGGNVTGVRQLTLQAVNGARPYVRLVRAGNGTRWTFRAAPRPANYDPEDPANDRTLVLDGLWLGLWPEALAAQATAGPAAPVPVVLALDGDFDEVVVRHCTIDPGGEQARIRSGDVMPIPMLQLEITGQVEKLVIEQSIVGPVRESSAGADACSAGLIIIRDSVVQSILPGTPAIETRIAAVEIERSTVFGDVRVDRLTATETLVQGIVQVTDNQHGCFRFSATNDHLNAAKQPEEARLPRQFESHLFADGIPDHAFVSRRFGDAGYAQFSSTVPETIRRGAANGSEIGVWSGLLAPIKLDDLTAKVLEFMPFELIPQFIEET